MSLLVYICYRKFKLMQVQTVCWVGLISNNSAIFFFNWVGLQRLVDWIVDHMNLLTWKLCRHVLMVNCWTSRLQPPQTRLYLMISNFLHAMCPDCTLRAVICGKLLSAFRPAGRDLKQGNSRHLQEFLTVEIVATHTVLTAMIAPSC